MKTKDKEIQKKINELCKLMGDNDRFIVFRKSGNMVDIALPAKEDENTDFNISSALASVIESRLLDDAANEGVDRLSEIIVDSIEALIGVSPLAGEKLTSRFARAALFGMKMTLDRTKNLGEDDDKKDDVKDCENCEFVKVCDSDDAIKYCKEHGIPKPKKGKKGRRKQNTTSKC